jgi:dTDP-glucose 4,6-dehydratase
MNEEVNLLITGAFGFVGQSFMDWLSQLPRELLPQEISLISRRPRSIQSKRLIDLGVKVKTIQADLTLPWSFEKDYTHVINLAADGSEKSYSEKANLEYELICKNLIEWSSDNSKLKKIFHTSSGACNYGTKEEAAGTFSEIPEEKRTFINSRTRVEEKLKKHFNGPEAQLIIARLYTFTGFHILGKNQYAISQFIHSAKEIGIVKIAGNPNTVRSYMSADDLSRWTYVALFKTENIGQVLDFGSQFPVTIKEIANYIASKFQSEVLIVNDGKDPDLYIPNTEFTRSILGESETRTWQEQIEELIDISISKI